MGSRAGRSAAECTPTRLAPAASACTRTYSWNPITRPQASTSAPGTPASQNPNSQQTSLRRAVADSHTSPVRAPPTLSTPTAQPTAAA